MGYTVEIKGMTYVVNFMEKDTSVDYIKWHNLTVNLNKKKFMEGID